MRVCRSTKFPDLAVHVFAIGHYRYLDKGEDEFSKKMIYFYKHGNDIDYFLSRLVDIYNIFFKKDEDKLKFDIITLVPTHEKDVLNQNMKTLMDKLSVDIGIPYEQILARNRTIKQQHELKNFEERYENQLDSIDITRDVKGKNILLLDNIVTTGITIECIAHMLKAKGAKNVLSLALGLSEMLKKSDYYLDGKMLLFDLITKFRSPKISKSIREEYKKSKGV